MTKPNKQLHIFRIIDARQSKRQSLWRTAVLLTCGPGALFWPGLLAGSAPMQWAGFALLMVFVVMLFIASTAVSVTIEEARRKLDAMESEQ